MIFGEALTALNRAATTSAGFVLGMIATLAPIVPLSRYYGATGVAVAFLAGIVTSTGFLFTALVLAVPGAWTRHRLLRRGLMLGVGCAAAYLFMNWVQAVAGAPVTIAAGLSFAVLVLLVRRRAA